MKPDLKWVACNGVKPDLPAGTKVRQIFMLNTDGVGISAGYPDYRSMSWDNVICYAIEPLDPVRELVEAAKNANYRLSFGLPYTRLKAAIKAVEEMKDDQT